MYVTYMSIKRKCGWRREDVKGRLFWVARWEAGHPEKLRFTNWVL